MATRWREPTPGDLEEWEEWLGGRPPAVRRVARDFPPWTLWRMRTGQRVFPVGYGEGEGGRVTLTVAVTARFNLVLFERSVHGIDPSELEPCPPPEDGDPVGLLAGRG